MRGLIAFAFAGLLLQMAWTQPDLLASRREGPSPLNPQHDARLNRLITLRVPSKPLKELLQTLSRETGVGLLVDTNIAEFRACLYVPNRPLHEVLHHLAEAFGYQWRRIEQEDRPPLYRLVDPHLPSKDKSAQMAREQLERLRELLPAICEQLRKPLAERRQALLDFIAEQGSSPPRFNNEAEFKQWVGRAFPLWAAYDNRSLGAWHALCRMSESEWQRLLNGETLFFSSKQSAHLPSEALRDWTEIVAERVKERYERFGRSEEEQHLKQEWELAQRKFPQADEMRVSLRYDKESGELYVGTLVFAQGENVVPASMGNKGLEWPVLRGHLSYSTFASTAARQREVRLPDHPAFQKPIEKFNPPGPWDDWFCWLGELLTQAAEATGIPLAGELYPLQPDSYRLTQLASLIRSLNWNRIAGLLTEWGYELNLSKQQWALVQSVAREKARAYDVPQAQLAKWFYKSGRRGVLTLEECAEVALLPGGMSENLYMYLQSYSQLLEQTVDGFRDLALSNLSPLHGGIEFARRTLVHIHSEIFWPEKYYILRLYGQLPAAQRLALRRGAEIPFESLPAPLQELFLKAWAKGSLLLFNDFWQSPAELARHKSTASLRLIGSTRAVGGIVIPDPIKRNIRTIEQFARWWQSQKDKPDHWREQAQQRRVWQFVLRWGDQTQVIEIEMHYPIDLEPPRAAVPPKSP